eukprot:Platyproteum_vivax@DN8588_c0_g1_i1.p1
MSNLRRRLEKKEREVRILRNKTSSVEPNTNSNQQVDESGNSSQGRVDIPFASAEENEKRGPDVTATSTTSSKKGRIMLSAIKKPSGSNQNDSSRIARAGGNGGQRGGGGTLFSHSMLLAASIEEDKKEEQEHVQRGGMMDDQYKANIDAFERLTVVTPRRVCSNTTPT